MSAFEHSAAECRYPAFLRLAHWVTVGLILVAYLSIYARKLLERGSPERLFTVELHFLVGLLVLIVTIPRLLAKLTGTAPPIVPAPSLASRTVSGTVHVAIILFLFVQPMLGIVTRLASGKGIGLPLSEWVIPGLQTPMADVSEWAEEAHILVGEVFIGVLLLHVLAALWHWKVVKDNTLQRML